jgi:hypothetical protein
MVETSNFLNFFIEECPFDTSSGVPKCEPIFFCSVSLVQGQTLRTFSIPSRLGMACDVRKLCIVLRGRHNVGMKRRSEGIEFSKIG